MKKTYLTLGILAFGCMTAASAAPTCVAAENLIAQYSANPTSASSGTLANGGGPICAIAPLTFTNISYNLDAGTFTTVPVNVTVETATLAGGQVQLGFDPNLGSDSDLELQYQVVGSVLGADLSAAISGGGFVDETVCSVFTNSGHCPTANTYAALDVGAGSATVIIGTPGSLCASGCSASTAGLVASVQFASAASEVWIIQDINSGSTPFNLVDQGYLTPEPMTVSLMGAGLVGLGLMRRRRNRK